MKKDCCKNYRLLKFIAVGGIISSTLIILTNILKVII